MADADTELDETEETDEDAPPRLDPEVAARRRAALAHVRQWGDPVLKSKARDIDVFDDELVAEARRMGALMDDALGMGLAATQLGRLRRILVYRVVPDAPLAVLVNPELEWASKEKETYEEGCLSIQGVSVDVERPVHVRVRARDERGGELVVEASGVEARVVQHEMDHLDGTLMLDRTTRDQRKEAIRTLRAGLEDK